MRTPKRSPYFLFHFLCILTLLFTSCEGCGAETEHPDVTLVVVMPAKGVITSDDGRINCGSECSVTLPYGSSVTLTASPTDSAWQFVSWVGGESGGASPTLQLTLLLDLTVEAQFALIPTCSDKTTNGSETDVDCGGSCSGCALGRSCSTTTDCVSGATCSNGRCSDTSAPTLGSGKLTATSLGTTSLALSWSEATDDFTPQQSLTYSLYRSAANPAYGSFSTVAEIEAGTLISSGTATSATINSGLSAGNSYYFNVVVSDQAGNKTPYSPYGEFFQANLSLFYPFNSNDNDITAAANNATPTNAPTFTADRFGFPASTRTFTSGKSQKLQSMMSYALGTSSRTLTLWLKAEASPGVVILAVTGASPGSGGTFGMYQSTTSLLWCFDVCDINTNAPITTSWEHWAVVYDSTTGRLTGYKNGSVAIGPSPPGGGATINTTTGPLTIGTGGNTVNMNDYWFGSTDDIRLYTRVLTATEIARMYEVTRP